MVLLLVIPHSALTFSTFEIFELSALPLHSFLYSEWLSNQLDGVKMMPVERLCVCVCDVCECVCYMGCVHVVFAVLAARVRKIKKIEQEIELTAFAKRTISNELQT